MALSDLFDKIGDFLDSGDYEGCMDWLCESAGLSSDDAENAIDAYELMEGE